jgi:hypothetical protein
LVSVTCDIVRVLRAGAHKGHVAAQDVEKLRKLIDFPAPK